MKNMILLIINPVFIFTIFSCRDHILECLDAVIQFPAYKENLNKDLKKEETLIANPKITNISIVDTTENNGMTFEKLQLLDFTPERHFFNSNVEIDILTIRSISKKLFFVLIKNQDFVDKYNMYKLSKHKNIYKRDFELFFRYIQRFIYKKAPIHKCKRINMYTFMKSIAALSYKIIVSIYQLKVYNVPPEKINLIWEFIENHNKIFDEIRCKDRKIEVALNASYYDILKALYNHIIETRKSINNEDKGIFSENNSKFSPFSLFSKSIPKPGSLARSKHEPGDSKMLAK